MPVFQYKVVLLQQPQKCLNRILYFKMIKGHEKPDKLDHILSDAFDIDRCTFNVSRELENTGSTSF